MLSDLNNIDMMKKLLTVAILGSVLGVIGSRVLFVGSSLSLIPWGICGVLIGFGTKSKKEALQQGAVYGFFLAFIFMVSGYEGSTSIITKFPFFALLGIVGSICGICLTLLSNFLSHLFTKK